MRHGRTALVGRQLQRGEPATRLLWRDGVGVDGGLGEGRQDTVAVELVEIRLDLHDPSAATSTARRTCTGDTAAARLVRWAGSRPACVDPGGHVVLEVDDGRLPIGLHDDHPTARPRDLAHLAEQSAARGGTGTAGRSRGVEGGVGEVERAGVGLDELGALDPGPRCSAPSLLDQRAAAVDTTARPDGRPARRARTRHRQRRTPRRAPLPRRGSISSSRRCRTRRMCGSRRSDPASRRPGLASRGRRRSRSCRRSAGHRRAPLDQHGLQRRVEALQLEGAERSGRVRRRGAEQARHLRHHHLPACACAHSRAAPPPLARGSRRPPRTSAHRR